MKILVPIDFSDRSKKALEIADKFADLMDGTVTPFYAHLPISELDEPYALGMSSKMYQNFEELEETLSNRVCEDSLKHPFQDRTWKNSQLSYLFSTLTGPFPHKKQVGTGECRKVDIIFNPWFTLTIISSLPYEEGGSYLDITLVKMSSRLLSNSFETVKVFANFIFFL